MKQKPKTPLFDKANPIVCIHGKMRQIFRLLNNIYIARYKKFGLQPSMISILFTVGKMKKASQRAIADIQCIDESTMSRDLGKLKNMGLINAVKSEGARQYELTLTNRPNWPSISHKRPRQAAMRIVGNAS